MNLTHTNTHIIITDEDNIFTISKDSFNIIKTLHNVLLKSKYNGNVQYTFTSSETKVNGANASIDEIYNYLLTNSSVSGNVGGNGVDLSNYAEKTYVDNQINSLVSEINTLKNQINEIVQIIGS